MPWSRADRLDHADRALDRAERVALQTEREREVEQHLRVRRAGDPVEQRRVDRQQQLAPVGVEAVEHAVVDEQPAAVAERVAVGLLHGRAGRRADVRQPERRLDVRRQVAQVRVAPGGRHAAVAPGVRVAVAVPAEPEAVAVGGLGAHAGVQALVDQPVRGAEEQLVRGDRLPEPCVPSAHAAAPLYSGARTTRTGRPVRRSSSRDVEPNRLDLTLPRPREPITTAAASRSSAIAASVSAMSASSATESGSALAPSSRASSRALLGGADRVAVLDLVDRGRLGRRRDRVADAGGVAQRRHRLREAWLPDADDDERAAAEQGDRGRDRRARLGGAVVGDDGGCWTDRHDTRPPRRRTVRLTRIGGCAAPLPSRMVCLTSRDQEEPCP